MIFLNVRARQQYEGEADPRAEPAATGAEDISGRQPAERFGAQRQHLKDEQITRDFFKTCDFVLSALIFLRGPRD